MSGKILPIDRQINVVKLHQTLECREKLKPIIKTIVLCGRQCLPLRTHSSYGQLDIS